MENGDKRTEHPSGLAHAPNVQSARSTTSASQSQRAPVPHTGALSFGHTPRLRCASLEGDSFEQPARPHTPASRLRAPYTRTPRRPFSLAALNSDRQRRHAKNNANDNHEVAQHPQMKSLSIARPQHHKLESIHDVYFLAKSSEIAEELTATAPLQFGRQSMNGTEKTSVSPHSANFAKRGRLPS